MKSFTPFKKLLAAGMLLSLALLASASGLISEEAMNVAKMIPARASGERGKQLATLQSYLLTQSVTVGLDPREGADPWKVDVIRRAVDIWNDSIPDSPFVVARDGEVPMVTVKFVSRIESGGDVQGQIEATRYLKWGTVTSYKLDAKMLVRTTTGRRGLRDDEFVEVIVHELGHLLGLDDANETSGIMGPFVPGRVRMQPSRAEIAAVIDYRDRLRETLARLQDRK